jgi:flagellar basal body L-ring protein FlgH
MTSRRTVLRRLLPSAFILLPCLAQAETVYTDRPAESAEKGAEPAHAPQYDAPGPVITAQAMQHNGGSLLRASAAVHVATGADGEHAKPASVSFFAVPEPEPKTIKKHDLVTIIVREESDSSAKATTDLKKNADITALLQQFISLKPKNFAIQGGAQGANPPGIQATGQRDFKGEATADRTDSFTMRVQAEVIDVKPNGNLVVQATKHVKWDDEDQYFTLSGTCRAEDVTADNSVLSTQLINLDVVKKTAGAVRDTSKRGFIPKMLDKINPF